MPVSWSLRSDGIPNPAPKTPPPTPPPQKPCETALTALNSLLTDQSLSDVTLISSEGTCHHAVRAILAVRSEYFRNMFFGKFQEAHQEKVQLRLSAAAIQNVLSFIYTDTCLPLHRPSPADAKRPFIDPLESCRQLSELLLAGDYLAVPSLVEVTTDALIRLLESYHKTACTILQMVPPSFDVHKRAREIVRKAPRDALGVLDDRQGAASHGAVLLLSSERLADVLKDSDLFTSDTYLFKVLKFWASSQDRKKQAQELSKYIDLERIKPSFLRDFVRPTGLVSEKRIRGTFEQQALEAERGRALFDNFRGGSVFANGTKFLRSTYSGFRNHVLGPWLMDGRHEWTFRIHSNSDCLWLGFACAQPSHDVPFFANGMGCAYSTDGKIRPSQNGQFGHVLVGPKLKKGGTVRIMLNLLKTGTMSIDVNGVNTVFTAFQGLKQSAKRLIPAICMSAPARIELIEERHHIGQ